jgi:hypothetical protein
MFPRLSCPSAGLNSLLNESLSEFPASSVEYGLSEAGIASCEEPYPAAWPGGKSWEQGKQIPQLV